MALFQIGICQAVHGGAAIPSPPGGMGAPAPKHTIYIVKSTGLVIQPGARYYLVSMGSTFMTSFW